MFNYKKLKVLLNNEISINSFFSFLLQIVGIILNYIFIYLVNKFYDSRIYGDFVLFISILNIFVIFGKFGMDLTFVKISAEYKNDKNVLIHLYKKVLIYVLIINFSIIMVGFFLKEFIIQIFNTKVLMNYYFFILLLLIPVVLRNINANILRGLSKIIYFNLLQNVLIYFIIIILIIINQILYLQMNLFILYSYTIFIVFFISLFLIYFYLLRNETNILSDKYVEGKLVKRVFKISFLLFLTNSIMLIYSSTDVIMLGIFTNSNQIAVYNICYKIGTSQMIFFMSIMSIFAPKIAFIINYNNIKKIMFYLKNIKIFLLVVSFIFIFIIVIFGRHILNMFGNNYISGYYVLLTLSFAFAIKNYLGVYEYILSMGNMQNLLLKISFASMILNIILNYLLIPQYYALGAAAATLISFIFYNILNYFFANKYLERL